MIAARMAVTSSPATRSMATWRTPSTTPATIISGPAVSAAAARAPARTCGYAAASSAASATGTSPLAK